jgi:hypothetical protein
MRDEAKKHIDDALANIRAIFEIAASRIEALPEDGKSKIPGTTMAKELGEQFGISGPTLYPTLLFLLRGYPGTVLRKGAHGGIVRLAPNQSPDLAMVPSVEDQVADADAKGGVSK